MRIVHLSDIHFWQYEFNPLRLTSKRLAGMASLVAGRARRFRLAGLPGLVARVRGLEADHLLITGDLTTTALPDEFRAARRALADLLSDPARVTIVPGNHDRYTWWSHRTRRFEKFLGEFAPQPHYPWLRPLDPGTAILGLDPTRAAITARGKIPAGQLRKARDLVAQAGERVRRLIVACHYPVEAPPEHVYRLRMKRLLNAAELAEWLETIGPHLFCCGHVHAAWAFRPTRLPDQLCLNPGAPLMVAHAGGGPPGFLEIELDGPDVTVHHHAWDGEAWRSGLLRREEAFFQAPARSDVPAGPGA